MNQIKDQIQYVKGPLATKFEDIQKENEAMMRELKRTQFHNREIITNFEKRFSSCSPNIDNSIHEADMTAPDLPIRENSLSLLHKRKSIFSKGMDIKIKSPVLKYINESPRKKKWPGALKYSTFLKSNSKLNKVSGKNINKTVILFHSKEGDLNDRNLREREISMESERLKKYTTLKSSNVIESQEKKGNSFLQKILRRGASNEPLRTPIQERNNEISKYLINPEKVMSPSAQKFSTISSGMKVSKLRRRKNKPDTNESRVNKKINQNSSVQHNSSGNLGSQSRNKKGLQDRCRTVYQKHYLKFQQ